MEPAHAADTRPGPKPGSGRVLQHHVKRQGRTVGKSQEYEGNRAKRTSVPVMKLERLREPCLAVALNFAAKQLTSLNAHEHSVFHIEKHVIIRT